MANKIESQDRTKKRRQQGGLTPRERAFCESYAGEAQGVGKRAAELAGYRGGDMALRVRASEMLAKPHVQAELERLRKATTSAAILTIQEIHETLTELARDVMVSPSDRIKACVELAKMRGHYAPAKHEVEHKGLVPVYLPDNGRDG